MILKIKQPLDKRKTHKKQKRRQSGCLMNKTQNKRSDET